MSFPAPLPTKEKRLPQGEPFVHPVAQPIRAAAGCFLVQYDLAVLVGIHHKGAAGGQGAVDELFGGGVLHGLADDTAQVAVPSYCSNRSAPSTNADCGKKWAAWMQIPCPR